MANEVKFDEQAMDALMRGVDQLADAVTGTLGPKGRNVAIAKSVAGNIYERVIVHDGVTVAKNIDPVDQFENMGASVLREAAQKMGDSVGDGTSVCICLAQAILKECLKMIRAGLNPMSLRQGLEEGSKRLVAELDKRATPVKTLAQKVQIATISAEDQVLGKLVAETLNEVGLDGVVTVEESKSLETFVDKQQGMQIDRGYASPYFVTDPDNMLATLEDSKLLVTDYKLETLVDLAPMFEQLNGVSTTLTVIAPEFSEQVLGLMVLNKMQGKVQLLAVKAPSFAGPNQKATLEDIAILTGANLVSADKGKKLKDTTLGDLGEVGYISADRATTVITGGGGKPEELEKRLEQIKSQIEDEGQEFDKQKLKERLGKLSGKISVIRVGGATEIEMKERKERVIDATEATRAATKAGIVPGGEVVYLSIREVLDQNDIAQKILYNALAEPFNRLVSNAGYDPGEIKAGLVPSVPRMGFDVNTGQVVDMLANGIIDPVLVPKMAIINAVSVAIQLALTGAVIVPAKEDLPAKK